MTNSKTNAIHLALRSAAILLLVVTATLSLYGCIRRTATITTDPPAAKVWINGVYRGESPVEIPYNWNWFYDIKVEKAGYQSLTTRERFYAPPQHVIGVDFITEVAPIKSEERQQRHYVLQPQKEL